MKKLFLILLLSFTLNARSKPVPEELKPYLDEIHEEYVKLILEERYFKTALLAASIPTVAGIVVAVGMANYLNK